MKAVKILISLAILFLGIAAGFYLWWYSVRVVFPNGGDTIYLVWLIVCCSGVPVAAIKSVEKFLKP